MDTTGKLQIVLDIDASGDSLTGRASTSNGLSRSFTGRLGLLTVLDAVLLDNVHAPAREDDQP